MVSDAIACGEREACMMMGGLGFYMEGRVCLDERLSLYVVRRIVEEA